ncbi:hypothetical protein CC78DRAFT_538214 [Lojkania enalia]|uniref:Secreted protein n=1 Tax=Lojkania enalia TaxID=147567 RepID=A0A9P4JY54_9PLEO|nr:hypothetical protein CC78DRAFT_538214 [Didymosphaeria enalia]
MLFFPWLAILFPLYTSAAPEAITVTVTEQCITPPEPTACPGPVCLPTCNIYDLNNWPNGGCASVNDRATCTVFNPSIPHPRSGQMFCMCQAGYRGDGLALDGRDQYRVTWTNALGDQTHRVFVRPGQTCNTLCNHTGATACDEVPLKDACR